MSESAAVQDRRGLSVPVLSALLAGAPVYPIVALSLVNAFDQLDSQVFGIALPNIAADLHFGLADVPLLTAPGGLLAIAVALVGGYLGDRINRVRLNIAANLGFAASCLLTAVSPTFAALATVRNLSSLTTVNSPSQGPLIADLYPPSGRGFAYGLWNNVKPFGSIAGALLAGVMITTHGWRATYFVLTIPVVAAILTLVPVKDPPRGRFDFDQASQAFARLARLGPLQTFRVLLNVRSWVRVLAGFAILGFGNAILFVGAFYYQAVFGIDPAGRGVITAVTAGFTFLGGIIGGAYLQRRAPRFWPLAGGAGLAVVAVADAAWAVAPNVPAAVTAQAVGSFIFGLTNTAIFLQLAATVPPHLRSMGFAIGTLPIVVGLVIWPPVAAALATAHSYRVAILASCFWYLLGALVLMDGVRFIDRDIERAGMVLRAEAEARQRRAAGERVDLLEVHELDVAYGTVQVLFDVNLRVAEGEMVALLGTNGAGKSTLLRAVSGLIRPTGGTVLYDGHDVTGMDAEALTARGMIHVPGGRGVFPGLTVGRHLRLATYLYRHDPGHRKESTERVLEIFPQLARRLDNQAGTLSGGEQQMLNLAQAMMMRPRLLLIDELSLGLAPRVVEELLQIVERIHSSGVTVVLVEQSVNIALELASRAYFLEKGEVRFEGRSEDLADREDLVRSVFLAGAR